ncbi:hypothetical protein E3J79_02800 [Candidatus Dependentiae bacterium]|nr:MAG: hypothetical protein E3J79_02800 [Candidatus Dependentiae bacterium]
MKKKCIVFVMCLVAILFNFCSVAKSLPKELEISQPALSGAPELKSALRISTEMMNVYKILFLMNKGLIPTIAIKKLTEEERKRWQKGRDRWLNIAKDLRLFVEKNAKSLVSELKKLEQINKKLFNTLEEVKVIDRDAVANFLEDQLGDSRREAEKIQQILKKKFIFGFSKKEARDLLVMFGAYLSESINLTLIRAIELTPEYIQKKLLEELKTKTKREKRRER